MLIQLRSEVTHKWYQFGLAVKIPTDMLDKYSELSPSECIVEVLDYWLRNQPNHQIPTWRDVANILEEIGFHQLAESILNVYQTGEQLHRKSNSNLQVFNIHNRSASSEGGHGLFA